GSHTVIDRYQAIATIMAHIGSDDLVLSTTGMISREVFMTHDRPGNFYMIGSMGLASAIALGLAVNSPKRKVVILDGDGNLLMNLGILTQIGALSPENLIHIVLDNEVYGSTGNQPTVSSQVRLEDIAKSSGYPEVVKVTERGTFETALKRCLKTHGPSFILAKIKADNMGERLSRVTHNPVEIKERFMRSVNGEERH
ncbi:MAG: thiamine pyrophosphate-dependent enzyme, partial [Candidatus Brocadiales bacterium]